MPMPTRTLTRSRQSFEARSVQMIAAWTLAMAGAGALGSLAAHRLQGTASPPAASSALGHAAPPLPARLPRK